MRTILKQIRSCNVCEKYLPLGANPIVAASSKSQVIIIGQAPGKIVHTTGIPWNDKSGDNLRTWMGVDKPSFYNTDFFALMPMGFCYPGKARAGDMPPRPECAPLWHNRLLSSMKEVKLILLIGQYAQNYYLDELVNNSLTNTVRNYRQYLPKYFPLPHPSPRNNIWQAKNEWFGREVLPELKKQIKNIITI